MPHDSRQYAADSRCVFVDRPGGLPELIVINDEEVVGPFCARCGNSLMFHRGTDNRCPKHASLIPGIHPTYRWGWLCEDCRPRVYFTESEVEANAHSDDLKHSLARCTAARATELKKERRAARNRT